MIYRLHPALQPYAWGGHDYIPALLRQPPDGTPKAELWYGDHPQAPALIEDRGQTRPLNEWLAAHPQAISAQSRARYGDRLPFLLKILDVRLPLSIQLHPDKTQAEAGYTRETQQNTPAAQRNYVDDNHKPESMIALSDFWLLHGFAPQADIETRLAARPSLVPLLKHLQQQGLAATYAHIMHASQNQLAAWLHPLLEQPAPQHTSADPDYWLHYTQRAMNIARDALDPGLLSFYLFNIVQLHEGEGIFQRARLPHAYLRGQNIEIMAASNNVLRAGLTPKHIDIPELLRIIDNTPVTPHILPQADHYPAPVDDYTLRTIHLNHPQTWQYHARQASIILTVRGSITLGGHHLHSGEAAFVTAGEHCTLTTPNTAYAVIASSA